MFSLRKTVGKSPANSVYGAVILNSNISLKENKPDDADPNSDDLR